MRTRLLLFALALFTPIMLFAQAFAPGDVIVTGHVPDPEDPFSTIAKALVFDQSGVFKRELLSQPNVTLSDIAISPTGTVFIARDFTFATFDPNGNLVTNSYQSEPAGLSSLSFAHDGRLFAGTILGVEIVEYATNGVQTRRMALPVNRQALGVDLAGDQCTLYYIDFLGIGGLDTCTSQAVTPINVGASSFRILPGGGFLVGGSPAKVVSSNGSVQPLPHAANVVALGLEPNTAWIGVSTLRKIDLTTGATLIGPINTGLPGFDAIAVCGEPRAALVPSTIPALSATLLALLAFAVIMIACTHLRSMS